MDDYESHARRRGGAVKAGQNMARPKVMTIRASRVMSGGLLAEDIGTQVVAAYLAFTFFIEAACERAVESRLRTQRLAQVADRRSATRGVRRLIGRNECCEVSAKGLHGRRLPFGNGLSTPFGTLPLGNGNWAP